MNRVDPRSSKDVSQSRGLGNDARRSSSAAPESLSLSGSGQGDGETGISCKLLWLTRLVGLDVMLSNRTSLKLPTLFTSVLAPVVRGLSDDHQTFAPPPAPVSVCVSKSPFLCTSSFASELLINP